MNPSAHRIVQTKNRWLRSQVDVEYPTPESLKGLALYQTLSEQRQVQPMSVAPCPNDTLLDEIFLVDFHRLTVMFALLQASQVESEDEQNLLVEFFTQIIFSAPCSLYVGFCASEPVAAAIVTVEADDILLSDIVVRSPQAFGDSAQFATAVLSKWCREHSLRGEAFIEL